MMPLAAHVARDNWVWFQLFFSLFTGVTGFVVFVPWALERRRRPEVRFQWRFSPDGDPANLEPWPPDLIPKVKGDSEFLVEAAIQNVGDRAGEGSLANFVVPDCFDLRSRRNPEAKTIVATNLTAGLPPHNRVVFFAPKVEPWTPGNWISLHYLLRHRGSGTKGEQLKVRLLFSIADSRFNHFGLRWLPSIVRPTELACASAGEAWPPAVRQRGWRRISAHIGWVRPMPRAQISCVRGEREDVRDLIVLLDGDSPAVPTVPEPPLNSGNV